MLSTYLRPTQKNSEIPKALWKYRSQVVRNTVKSLKQGQLIKFEKYNKGKMNRIFCDRRGGRGLGIAYSSSWMMIPKPMSLKKQVEGGICQKGYER